MPGESGVPEHDCGGAASADEAISNTAATSPAHAASEENRRSFISPPSVEAGLPGRPFRKTIRR